MEYENAPRALRAATTLRGWVTRRIVTLAGSVAALETTPSSTLASSKVSDDMRKLEDALEKATEAYVAYTSMCDEDKDAKDADAVSNLMADEAALALQKAITALSIAEAANTPAAPAPPAAPVAAAPPSQAALLKPERLLSGSTPSTATRWQRQFKAYFSQMGANAWTPEAQHALFTNCVDKDVWQALERAPTFSHLAPALPTVPPAHNSLLELLEDHITAENPIFNRRIAWYTMTQASGETSSEFLGRLREQADLADIARLTFDEGLVLRALSGITDKTLGPQLRRIDGAVTFRIVQDRCMAFDREKKETKAAEQQVTAKAAAANAQQKPAAPHRRRRGGDTNNGHQGPTHPQGDIPAALTGKCGKCGDPNHTKQECKMSYAKLRCRYCGKQGHWDKACYTKARDEEKGTKAAAVSADPPPYQAPEPNYTASSDEEQAPPARARHVVAVPVQVPSPRPSGKARVSRMATPQSWPTPRVPLKWKQSSGASFRAKAVADTGTTFTVMSGSYLRHLFTRPSAWELSAADGKRMDASREASFTVTRCDGGGPPVSITAIISEDLPAGDILLSWVDQIRLGLLHPEWPSKPPPETSWDGDNDWEPPHRDSPRNVHGESAALASLASGSSRHQRLPDTPDSLMAEFSDVLDDNLTADKRLKGDPLTINFKEGPISPYYATNARPVPVHLETPGRHLVDSLVKKGILVQLDANTTSQWLSRGHFVPKPGRPDEARLVTDYIKLNGYIRRPVHPFPSAEDVFKMVKKGSKWFAKLDAVHGYFQLPLSKESQLCTAFLLPWGRYMYTAAPMGLSPSGDWFCQRTDEILAGIDGVIKLVDDILVMGETKEELYSRIRAVLRRSRDRGLTLSRKKMVIGQQVEFAGHVINADGVSPAEDGVAAIRNFPTPSDIVSLRSFMGCANQLMSFVPDLSHAMREMRTLLCKGTPWEWTKAIDQEFCEVKKMLSSTLLVRHYDTTTPATLITDACSHGLGYLMVQRQKDGTTGIITCGSRSTSPAESRYAPIELETLGVRYAARKCEFYLRGNPHTTTVLTDHRPLEGLFRKNLSDVSNSRVQRLREKLVGLDLRVRFVPGKDNIIADALSRAPLFPAPEEEPAKCCAVGATSKLGANLSTITADIDEDYKAVVAAWHKRLPNPTSLGNEHPAAAYAKVWENLSLVQTDDFDLLLYNGDRIVIPVPARREVLRLLHAGHAGVAKTTQAARQLYYWPGMSQDIDAMVSDCNTCQELRPSKPLAQVEPAKPATFPMEALGADIFHCGGKDWLVAVDRFSGFPWVSRLHSLTSSAVISRMEAWLWTFGLPNCIRTDGGPQFDCKEFKEYLDNLDIEHELSSPYNPSSNGLAEAGVKQVKHLMLKCASEGSNYTHALHAYRNTPRADGYSPFQLMFGRMGKTLLPALNSALATPADTTEGAKARELAREAWKAACAHRRRKSVFHPGDLVYVQNPITGHWRTDGTISSATPTGSYIIRFEDGSEKRRSEKFIRLQKSKKPVPESAESVQDSSVPCGDHAPDHAVNCPDFPPPDSGPVHPRRSPRLQARYPSYAAAVAASLPAMFGFSPYVSTSKDAHHAPPAPMTSIVCSMAGSTAPSPPTRRSWPTMPRTSPRPSTGTSPDPAQPRPSTGMLLRTSTKAVKTPSSASTRRVWASPSGRSLLSSSHSLSPGPALGPTAAAYLTAAQPASRAPEPATRPLPPYQPSPRPRQAPSCGARPPSPMTPMSASGWRPAPPPSTGPPLDRRRHLPGLDGTTAPLSSRSSAATGPLQGSAVSSSRRRRTP